MTDISLPPVIGPLVEDYSFQRVGIGESGARVFRLTRERRPRLFLKCARGSAGAELVAEADRLRWLIGRAPVPEVIALAAEGPQTCLLLAALPGRNAAEVEPERAPAVVVGLARTLRGLHAQSITTCPFDQSLATQIERARERTRAGLVDEQNFDEERRGSRAADLLLRLDRDRPREEDAVLTHGDACLPNAIFQGARSRGS